MTKSHNNKSEHYQGLRIWSSLYQRRGILITEQKKYYHIVLEEIIGRFELWTWDSYRRTKIESKLVIIRPSYEHVKPKEKGRLHSVNKNVVRHLFSDSNISKCGLATSRNTHGEMGLLEGVKCCLGGVVIDAGFHFSALIQFEMSVTTVVAWHQRGD